MRGRELWKPIIVFEPRHDKSNKNGRESSEDSDQKSRRYFLQVYATDMKHEVCLNRRAHSPSTFSSIVIMVELNLKIDLYTCTCINLSLRELANRVTHLPVTF